MPRARIAGPVLLAALVFSGLLLIGLAVVRAAVTPDGDLAADMLLGNVIRDRGLLLTGHYSRFEFHHPGPFFFYWNYVFEQLLGWTGLSRFQIWTLGSIVLNSLVVSLAADLFSVAFLGRFAFAAAASFALATVAILQADLIGLWMPLRIVAPYLAFLLTIVLLAQGRLKYLPLSVLLASVCIHGYASMPLFTLPFLVVAFGFGLRQARAGGGLFRILAVAGAIGAVFAAPIVYDLLFVRPSNFSVILSAGRGLAGMGKPPVAEMATFLRDVLAQKFSLYCVIAVLIVAAMPRKFCFDDAYARTFGAVALLVLALTVVTAVYLKNTPGPLFIYMVQFYQAVVPLMVGASLAAPFFVKGVRAEHVPRSTPARMTEALPWVHLVLAFAVLLFPVRVVPAPHSDPEIVGFVRAASAPARPVVLDYGEHGMWPFIAGLLLEFDRARVPACTTWNDMAFLYTDKEICRPGAVPNLRVVKAGECGAACFVRAEHYGLIRLD